MRFNMRSCAKNFLLCLFFSSLTLWGGENTLSVNDLSGMITSNDPSVKISREGVRLALEMYLSAYGDALPQIYLDSGYTLIYTPETKMEEVPFIRPETLIEDSGSHLLHTGVSLSQLLPTAGSLAFTLENTMGVETSGSKKEGEDEPQSMDPEYSQRPEMGLSISQPVFLNGKFIDMDLFPASVRKARIGYLKEEQVYRNVKNRAILNALSLYFNIIGLRRNIENQEESIGLTGSRLKQAEQNFRLGLIAETDVWEINIFLGSQNQILLDLRYSLLQAERTLARSLGLDDLSTYTFTGTIPAVSIPYSDEELANRSLSSHPLIQQDILSAEEGELDGILSGQQHASTLSLSFSVNPKYPASREDTTFSGSVSELFEDDSEIDYTFSASLRVPLYKGGKRKHDTESSAALLRITQENLRMKRETVLQQLEILLLKKENLEDKIRLLETDAALQERRLEMERNLLSLGKSTDVDVSSRRIEFETKSDELWRTRADLYISILEIFSQIGEDVQQSIEGTDL